MPANAWDTSALLRRYVASEPGAGSVESAFSLERSTIQMVAPHLSTEVASALTRKARLGEIEISERDSLWRRFTFDLSRQYRVIELDDGTLSEATRIVFRLSVKASDAVHIAAALKAQRVVGGDILTFWTADRKQARAAEAEGLEVELLP